MPDVCFFIYTFAVVSFLLVFFCIPLRNTKMRNVCEWINQSFSSAGDTVQHASVSSWSVQLTLPPVLFWQACLPRCSCHVHFLFLLFVITMCVPPVSPCLPRVCSSRVPLPPCPRLSALIPASVPALFVLWILGIKSTAWHWYIPAFCLLDGIITPVVASVHTLPEHKNVKIKISAANLFATYVPIYSNFFFCVSIGKLSDLFSQAGYISKQAKYLTSHSHHSSP